MSSVHESSRLSCTQKLRKLLPVTAAPVDGTPEPSTELYANLLWFDRKKCILVTEARTLFSFFVPDVRKGDLNPIGSFLIPRLELELVLEGLPRDLFGSLDSDGMVVGSTRDRAVLGSHVEFGRMCGYRIDDSGGLALTDIAALNHWLRRIPMGRHHRTYTFPIDAARALLAPPPGRT